MPSSPAPFVSFNDYLDANSGSLEQGRSQVLGSADASIGALGGDIEQMKTAAFGQGADQAKAAWGQQRAEGRGPGGKPVTSSEQYRAPTSANINLSTLPGQESFAKHKAEAETAVTAMGQGGLGQGKTAFEAGLIGADTGFQGTVQGKQKQLGDTVNGYLDQINAAGMQGVQSFKPNPIITHQTEGVPDSTGAIGPDGSMHEGPVMKPQRRTRTYKNGEPQPFPDEEMYP